MTIESTALASIVVGVVSNALTSLLACAGKELGKIVVGKDLLEKMELRRTSVSSLLQQAIGDVSEELDWQNPLVLTFLRSPEVEAMVRQVFACKLSDREATSRLAAVEQEFSTSLALSLDWPPGRQSHVSHVLFQALVNGCDQALQVAIDKGILAGHEAKSAFRYNVLLDELAVIEKNVEYLIAAQKPNVAAILEFEKTYRSQVGGRAGYITPPHFDTARRLPIDTLFVAPKFVKAQASKQEKQPALSMPEFLSGVYRVVVLGDPGGGKSTFACKACHELATRYPERIVAGRQLTPIPVVLRDYGAHKKAQRCSVLQFIATTANTQYQVDPPPAAFEYLLLNGRAMVIFDGLDELLDSHYRQEISGDIEAFCRLYPTVPVIVTSRRVGYEQAPLDSATFEAYGLTPFDEDQVQDYVTKWFSADPDLSSVQKQDKARGFMKDSQAVRDLRSNPLMLALMCNIYRGENYIPRNRPDVYEKCAVMLFDRWDKSRNILVPLPIEAHIRPTLMHLAYWIYSNERLESGVTERRLIAQTATYLHPRRFEDRDDAETAARSVVEFCRGRAWVFTDTGLTKDGEPLYQFTHRTFLEYFTAAHIVRTQASPQLLWDFLQPRIAKSEWDVVAQIAFQIQNRNLEGAADQLLTTLLDQSQKADPVEQANYLSFAARCLEAVIPSPRVTRLIVSTCVTRSLQEARDYLKSEDVEDPLARVTPRLRFPWAGIVGALLICAEENRPTVESCIEKELITRIVDGDDADAALALQLGAHLGLLVSIAQGPENPRLTIWADLSGRVLAARPDRLQDLSTKYVSVCYLGIDLRQVSIDSMIRWHGLESLFRPVRPAAIPHLLKVPIALSALNRALRLDPHPASERARAIDDLNVDLGQLASALRASPGLFRSTLNLGPYGVDWYEAMFLSARTDSEGQTDPGGVTTALNSNALFGIFLIAAIWSELTAVARSRVPRNRASWLSKGILVTVLARSSGAVTKGAQSMLEQSGLSKEQQDFIRAWIRQEFSFIKEDG